MSRSYHLKRKYGITEEQYAALLDAQGGCCAICKRSPAQFRKRLAVDHDHKSGEIRGLLCFNCNKFRVGRNRKEVDLRELQATILYLDREYTGWMVPPKPKRKKRRCRKKRKDGKLS